jgi:hypothetical protein
LVDLWIYDLESLEVVSEDEDAREVVHRLACLARAGQLHCLIDAVTADPDIDDDTKAWMLELARNEPFLIAVDVYVARFRDVN